MISIKSLIHIFHPQRISLLTQPLLSQLTNAYTKYSFNQLLLKLRQPYEIFWNQNPALLYGFGAAIGASFALFTFKLSLFLSMVIITCPIISPKLRPLQIRFIITAILGITNFYLVKSYYIFPNDEQKNKIKGVADIEFSSTKNSKTPFGPIHMYRGTILSFIDLENSENRAKNIPFTMILPTQLHQKPLQVSYRYQIEAFLEKKEARKYVLKPTSGSKWIAQEKQLGFAEWRKTLKSRFQKHIQRFTKNPHTAAFLSGIGTGEFDDFQLSSEMNRFGLQHIMAVSGLHFSILATLLSFSLRLFFPRIIVVAITVGLMGFYFFFLGFSASVLRAWIAITIALCGLFVRRRSLSLNSLGVALLCVATAKPLWLENIAFQFSFAATGSILLWFKICESLLNKIFTKRTLSEVVELSSIDQHGYCLLAFLRQMLALSLAVNLTAIPLTLYYFQKFPLLSLGYNLFFPFMLSISLLFLFLSTLIWPISEFLSLWIHSMNETYTNFLINLTFNFPKKFDIYCYVSEIPFEFLILYLVILFAIGIFAKSRIDVDENSIFRT